MDRYVQLDIIIPSNEMSDILVASLSAAGFDGFEEDRGSLKAYIPQKQFNEERAAEILRALPVTWNTALIEPQNWNQRWEAEFQPVLIDDFCQIRAEFHPPSPDVVYDLVITPKMSFGTGHHATTFLMVAGMRPVAFTGKQVCDFGTGTGVLAILAEKMGAAGIDAIDNDDWSIENAGENLAANGCSKVSLFKAGTLPARRYDVILANINRNVILAQIGDIADRLDAGGRVLLSGFLEADAVQVINRATRYHLRLFCQTAKHTWSCLHFVKA